jgi:hypothetical protein
MATLTNMLHFFVSFIAVVSLGMVVVITMLFGIPKALDWWEMNMAKDYLENRAERNVRDLRKKIRVVELENESIELEKKLNDAKKNRQK